MRVSEVYLLKKTDFGFEKWIERLSEDKDGNQTITERQVGAVVGDFANLLAGRNLTSFEASIMSGSGRFYLEVHSEGA